MKSLADHKILSLKKIAFLQLNTSYSKCEATSYTSSNFRTKAPSSLPKIRFWAAVLKKSSSFQISSSSQFQKYLFDWFGMSQKGSCRFTPLTCAQHGSKQKLTFTFNLALSSLRQKLNFEKSPNTKPRHNWSSVGFSHCLFITDCKVFWGFLLFSKKHLKLGGSEIIFRYTKRNKYKR